MAGYVLGLNSQPKNGGQLVDTIVLNPDDPNAQDVPLSFSGVVRSSDGTTFANSVVQLHSTPRTTTADAQGRFFFFDVESGEHTLTITDENGSQLAQGSIVLDNAASNAGLALSGKNEYSFSVPTDTLLVEISVVVGASSNTLSIDQGSFAIVQQGGVVTTSKGTETVPADGVVLTPQGTSVLAGGVVNVPFGGVILGNGVLVSPDGTVTGKNGTAGTLPQGVTLSDGKAVLTLPDGTNVNLADSTAKMPDGTMVGNDNTITLPDGSIIDNGADALITPGGTRISGDGTITLSNGTKVDPSVPGTLADGTVVSADGTVTLPDGTVISAGGAVTTPGGKSVLPPSGGGTVVGAETAHPIGATGSADTTASSGATGTSGATDSGGTTGTTTGGTTPVTPPTPSEPEPQPDPGTDVPLANMITAAENGISWTQLSTINLFSANNSAADGKLYPGVSGSYAFTVANPQAFAVRFTLTLAEAAHAAGAIPFEYRLKSGTTYLAGSGSSWLSANALDDALVNLAAGGSTAYTLEWRWPLEGNDALDTAIGQNGTSHTVSITIRAEQVV